ncbi:MAG: FAD binding domain-containing protein, partial [Desulfobacterales bacterium]|nr:FAD binding domain-containing protein [Desulfobacterales bacterium]
MTDMNYIRARDLDHALSFLSQNGPDTEILAGGTDVMVDLRAGELDQKKNLLDISRIDELNRIDFEDGKLSIGAGVTLSRINRSDLIQQHAPALTACSKTFAGKQIRNKATVGGNVAHASPCGDTIPPLVIHDARALVATRTQQRR